MMMHLDEKNPEIFGQLLKVRIPIVLGEEGKREEDDRVIEQQHQEEQKLKQKQKLKRRRARREMLILMQMKILKGL